MSTVSNAPSISLAPTHLADLAAAFARAGRQLYLVGGMVRDRLLGRPSFDYDFTTDAVPEETRRILSAVSTNVYAPGERFGTICAGIDGYEIQVTTFRGEQYDAGSRKPRVRYEGLALEDDLGRRDFTINAMAVRLDGPETPDIDDAQVIWRSLEDPFHGYDDLRRGLIRAVGDPEARFAEDPLRLLRAVRQAAQLGFEIEEATAQAIRQHSRLLATISRERVGMEMEKLLLSPKPSRGIVMMKDLELLHETIPELLPMIEMQTRPGRRHKDVFGHVMQVLDKTPATRELRWAGLLNDIAKPQTMSVTNGDVHFFGHEILGAQIAERILARLKYDAVLIGTVTTLVAQHMRINTYSDWTDGAVRRFMRDAGPQLENLYRRCSPRSTPCRHAARTWRRRLRSPRCTVP
jgi:poly(A) polymerase